MRPPATARLQPVPVRLAAGVAIAMVFAAGLAAQSHANVLTKYCVTCHNEKLKTGGLSLEGASLSNIPARAETWEKVIRKLRTRTMPPAGLPRPDDATS